MRLLFAGTPRAAVPSLEALVRSAHEVVAVLTRPDAVAGRGRQVVRSAVAECASDLAIPVWTSSPRDPDFVGRLADLRVDCCPVVAFGSLIPQAALAIPAHGWVNLHFSVLPAWRGAAPVQHAIMHGDTRTGATTFQIDAGLDTGPTLLTMEADIGPRDTSGDVLERLSLAGADLLVATIDGLAAGTVHPVPQPPEGATYAPKIDVDDARVDWSRDALTIDRLVRACTPAPGAWTSFRGERIKVGPLALVDETDLPPTSAAAPGELRAGRRHLLVGTATAPVALGEVTPQGKRPMAAADWARGVRPAPGEAFA